MYGLQHANILVSPSPPRIAPPCPPSPPFPPSPCPPPPSPPFTSSVLLLLLLLLPLLPVIPLPLPPSFPSSSSYHCLYTIPFLAVWKEGQEGSQHKNEYKKFSDIIERW